jgi:hypothetical protein
MSTPPIGTTLYAANGHYYQLISNTITVNGHTFQYPVSYDEAVQLAFEKSTPEWDAHLATITDAGESDFLMKYLDTRSKNTNAWIGAKVVNGSAQWVTGETTNYQNFEKTEPTANDYAIKGTGSGYFGKWSGYALTEKTIDYVVEYTPNTSPREDNLLTNPGAEPILDVTNDFLDWTQDVTDRWGLTTLSHSGYRAFVSGNTKTTLSQTIDLVQKGFSNETLDKAPIIDVGTFVRWGLGASADNYEFKVSLLGVNDKIITSYYEQGSVIGDQWKSLSHSFMFYGAGLRSIKIEQTGEDSDKWLGYYGAVFDDAYVHFYDVPIGTFTIDDTTPQLGQKLTAISTLTDSDGFSGVIDYTWMSGNTIVGTDSTYTTVAKDIGKQISAIASYTNTKGGLEKIASLLTDPVANVTDVKCELRAEKPVHK